jgi:hypothetical protein
MWDPQLLTTPWASTACYRDSFTFLHTRISFFFFARLICYYMAISYIRCYLKSKEMGVVKTGKNGRKRPRNCKEINFLIFVFMGWRNPHWSQSRKPVPQPIIEPDTSQVQIRIRRRYASCHGELYLLRDNTLKSVENQPKFRRNKHGSAC